MTRDVFKYFKQVRSLQESTTSERAHELGYEYQARGVWLDPKNGKRYKADGVNFKEIPQQEVSQREPAAQEEPQKKTLSQFKKETEPQQPQQEPEPSVADQNSRNVPGGPNDAALSSGDKMTVKKMLSRGREQSQSPERKKQIDQQADDMIAQYDAEKEAEEIEAQLQADAEEQERQKEMGTPEGPLKDPSEFKTINQALQETGENFDGSQSDGDVDRSTEQSIQRVSDISNTDVNDPRFDKGRQSQKRFLEHYSQDSEYRSGLDTLSKSIARSTDRTKVNEMMDAIDSGDYLRQIQLTKNNSKSVSELLLDAGIDVNDEQQIKQFKNAYDEINSFIGDDGYFKRGEAHELVGSNLGYFEAQHIAEREDLKNLDVPGIQTKAFNTASEMESPLAENDPVITDAVYSLLPTPARDFLSKSGSPGKFYDPREKDSQGKSSNPIRGSAALHMWGMQDGRDAYALSGQRRSPGEFQVEHIQPLKAGGRDHIENFGMLLRRVNEPRADLPFEKFQEQAKRKKDSVDADLSSPKVRERLERSYRASSFNSELAPVMGGDIGTLIDPKIMNKVNSGLESKLGKESSASLKMSEEDYTNYQNKVNDFLQSQGLDSKSQLRDLDSNQLNGLFDIIGEGLGVDKVKLNEYMGRNLINNYNTGARSVIDKDGNLVPGRGGTTPTSGNLLNMQNSIFSDDSLSPEEKKMAISGANSLFQDMKKTRNAYIENASNPQTYENYLSDVVKNIDYLTGEGDTPLKSGRKYDTRLTGNSKHNIDSDIGGGIMSLLSLDTASVSGGKDGFSPGFQKGGLTPQSKEHVKNLRKKLVSSYVNTSGFSEEEISNPDSLTKSKRKKIEPLLNALENIDRGLAS